MLVLDTTSTIIRVWHQLTLSSAPAYIAAWADSNATSLTEGRSAVTATLAPGSTDTLVAAPAASTKRDIKDIWINHPLASGADNYRVEFYDGSTAFILWAGQLSGGDTLHIGNTIEVIDSSGNRKTQGIPQGAANLIYASPNGGSGSASLRAMLAADMPNAGVAGTGLSGTWPNLSVVSGHITAARTDTTNDGGTLHQAENILHNGRFTVTQRAPAANPVALVNNTLMYADLDRWKVKVAGTTGSGNFSQAISVFNPDFSIYCGKATLTTTGSGTFTIRQYIEGRNAVKLYNRNAVFSSKVLQDSGGALNYVMNIYPMTALDNGTLGSALTGGNLGANQSVPNNTETLITSGAIAMGTNMNLGCVVEIVITLGAVTTKNFSFGQTQLQLGSTVTPMDVEDFQAELTKCLRYYQKSYPYTTKFPQSTLYGYNQMIGQTGGTLAWCGLIFPVEFRIIPTMLIVAPTSITTNTVYDTVTSAPIAFVTGVGDLSTKCLGYLAGTGTAGRIYLYGWQGDADF